MIEQVRKCSRKLDIFGKPITLKFDKDWDTHETKMGGFLTVMFVILIIVYSTMQINVMLGYGQDNIKNIYQNTDYEKLGSVQYNETKFYLFAYLNGNLVDRF